MLGLGLGLGLGLELELGLGLGLGLTCKVSEGVRTHFLSISNDNDPRKRFIYLDF